MRGVRERDEEDEDPEPPPDAPCELELGVLSREPREELGGKGGSWDVEEMTAAPVAESRPRSIGG